ncbi:MAG: hypothetical protein EU550_01480 [Promethearchaeota archaeon]|nr:MAG: hypothetical protein EU550_01480 [Candidatus Lokiarchaeota archaeon]
MLTERDVEQIKKEMEHEFPNDMALQQVHIARKILAKEAELKGISYFDYINQLSKDLNLVQ